MKGWKKNNQNSAFSLSSWHTILLKCFPNKITGSWKATRDSSKHTQRWSMTGTETMSYCYSAMICWLPDKPKIHAPSPSAAGSSNSDLYNSGQATACIRTARCKIREHVEGMICAWRLHRFKTPTLTNQTKTEQLAHGWFWSCSLNSVFVRACALTACVHDIKAWAWPDAPFPLALRK